MENMVEPTLTADVRGLVFPFILCEDTSESGFLWL